MLLVYVSGVNYNVNSNAMKYMAQNFGRFFAFWNISTRNSESCGATYRRNCEIFSALQGTSGALTTRLDRLVTDGGNNAQIDA